MTPIVQSVTDVLAFFTLIGCAGALFLLLFFLFGEAGAVRSFLSARAALFSLLIALFGMASSLFYSQFAHFDPCTLCWWQRALLYPQTLVFAAALWKSWKNVWRVSLPLSAAGVLLAAYQVYLQFGGTAFVACSAGGSASCAKRYFLAFGFVTIPVMSLVAFVLLVALGLYLVPRRVSR